MGGPADETETADGGARAEEAAPADGRATPERSRATGEAVVVSADGTRLAVERHGTGPTLVAVGGAFCDRTWAVPLAAELAGAVSVVTYDRRGRGGSGDTAPYAVDREVEDLDAVVRWAGAAGAVAVLGHSSGAALALEAVAAGVPVSQLVVYEPPYSVDEDDAGSAVLAREVDRALAQGRPEDAVEAFFADMPPEVVDDLRGTPTWWSMVALAPTLPYDLAVVGDGPVPGQRLAGVRVPTLCLDGADSPGWARAAVAAVAAAVPEARRLTLPGQDHGVAPQALAPVLVDLLTDAGAGR